MYCVFILSKFHSVELNPPRIGSWFSTLLLVYLDVTQKYPTHDWSEAPIGPAPSSTLWLRISVILECSTRTESEFSPEISFIKHTVSVQSASLSGSRAGRSTELPSTHTKPSRIPRTGSLSTSQLRGARRGAAGADGTRSGEGEAAGSAIGVNPAGRQRWARGGNMTWFRGPERTRNQGRSAGRAFTHRKLQFESTLINGYKETRWTSDGS